MDNTINSYLREMVWHNMPKVNALFKNSFNIEFTSHIKNIMPKILLRHNIVHRNGKDTDGKETKVNIREVEELVELVNNLAKDIEVQKDNNLEF